VLLKISQVNLKSDIFLKSQTLKRRMLIVKTLEQIFSLSKDMMDGLNRSSSNDDFDHIHAVSSIVSEKSVPLWHSVHVFVKK